jgi:hypothetical protein
MELGAFHLPVARCTVRLVWGVCGLSSLETSFSHASLPPTGLYTWAQEPLEGLKNRGVRGKPQHLPFGYTQNQKLSFTEKVMGALQEFHENLIDSIALSLNCHPRARQWWCLGVGGRDALTASLFTSCCLCSMPPHQGRLSGGQAPGMAQIHRRATHGGRGRAQP